MTHDTQPNHLDDLLATAAPRGGGPRRDGDRVLAAAINEARPSLAKWRRRPARTALVAGVTALALTGGGLAAAATIEARSGGLPWSSLTSTRQRTRPSSSGPWLCPTARHASTGSRASA